MTLTQKETMLLQDMKSQEQLCVEKYTRAAQLACDGQLKKLFEAIAQIEQGHLDTINQLLNGVVPMMSGGQGSDVMSMPTNQSNGDQASKQQDKYLCEDTLGTEKRVSGDYNTVIFEMKDENARNVLNHIQKEEQQHGKKIYDYMAANGMY